MASPSQKALKKILLHAARHSAQDVLGVFSNEDAFPLFHSRVTTVAMEVALTLLKDVKISGFYESRIRASGTSLEPSRLACNLALALKAKGTANVWVLCVECDWEKSHPVVLFELIGNGLVKRNEISKEQLREALQEVDKSTEIFDFDDHFDNPMVDWKNSQVV
jgi:hypothetical protein